MRIKGRSLLAAAVVGAGLCASATHAADNTIAMPAEGEAAAPPVNSGKISLSAGVDFYTHYYFRGILQENQGLITQPYIGLGFNVFESDGPINNITINVGTWNSFHTGPTGNGDDSANPEGSSGDPSLWYEADLYAGVSIGLFNDFTAGVTYTAYTSPNDRFNTVQDLTLSLSYSDGAIWEGMGLKGFALNPSAALIIETEDEADANSILGLAGSSEGVYLQLGIAPSFTVCDSKAMPVTLTIPVTVGLSISDYYEIDSNADGIVDKDETFGFVDVGLVLSTPLAFIPAEFGSWEAKAGVHFLFLGDTTEVINGGDDFEVIGQFSISMSY